MTPWGPIDPRDAPVRAGSPIAPPFPDLAISAGRRTVPYLRHVKRASGGRTFTIFVKDPYTGPGTADVIWIPEHDKLRADNVVVTLTPAHRLRPEVFGSARVAPDARLRGLPHPRVAMVLGGKGVNHRFEPADIARLAEIARTIAGTGASLMVTPSRRTPPAALAAIEAALGPALAAGRAFVWDGQGANPYAQILAHASAIVVTGDSANMVGEATATGAPVHVYEPTGGHPKVTRYLDRLVAGGRGTPLDRIARSLDLYAARLGTRHSGGDRPALRGIQDSDGVSGGAARREAKHGEHGPDATGSATPRRERRDRARSSRRSVFRAGCGGSPGSCRAPRREPGRATRQ